MIRRALSAVICPINIFGRLRSPTSQVGTFGWVELTFVYKQLDTNHLYTLNICIRWSIKQTNYQRFFVVKTNFTDHSFSTSIKTSSSENFGRPTIAITPIFFKYLVSIREKFRIGNIKWEPDFTDYYIRIIFIKRDTFWCNIYFGYS